MRQLIFFICVFSISIALRAQNIAISGHIQDSATGRALIGVSIQEVNNLKNGTITDSLGNFGLQISSNSILVQHVGYQNRVVVAKNSSEKILIFLAEETDMLNQIVITGNKTEKRLRELTMSLETLRPDLVRDKNPVVMDEVINQIPGVSVTDDQVSIRAGSGWSYGAGSRVTVLVDGAPLMNGDAGNVLWTFISSDHLGSVEVLKGASSVLYGSSALNGIINISTKWPSEIPTSTVTLFSGIYSNGKRSTLKWTDDVLNSSGARLSDSRKLGKSDFNSNLEYISNDGYRFGDFERRTHIGEDWRYHLTPDMQIGLRSHLLITETGSFLLWKSYDSAYNALDNAATVTNGLKFRIDPFWVYRTSKNWLHKVNSRYLRVVNNVDSGNPDIDQSNSANTYYADYQITTPKFYGFQAIGGTLLTQTVSSSPLFGGNQKSANMALYTQVEKEWKRLIVNVGARLEHYALNDYVETKPVFRSGLNYRAAKATFIRASYGEGYRFPTIAESFIQTKVGVVSVFPNNNLKSETGFNAEIGVKQGFKKKNLKGFVDVAAFRMRYNDMMEFTFSQWSKDVSLENGLGLGFKSLNTGNTQISGFDISVNGAIEIRKDQQIKVLMGYTYSNPISLQPDLVFGKDSVGTILNYRNTSSDTTDHMLKYRNRHLVKADIYYSKGNWECGYSMRFNSFAQNIDAKFVQQPLSIFIPGIAQGQELNKGGILISDVRLFYNFKNQLRAGVIVNNLFNTEFMVRPGDMGPPRLMMLQVRKEIKGKAK